jgi:hypothetical protein
MTTITDEYMKQMLATMKDYSLVILKPASKRNEVGADSIVWEHGRRNFVLRAEGRLSIVCPISANSQVSGLCIFNTNVEETKKIMDEDPSVKAGIFQYDIYSCKGFPGDSLAR